jgi:hypothetical protein
MSTETRARLSRVAVAMCARGKRFRHVVRKPGSGSGLFFLGMAVKLERWRILEPLSRKFAIVAGVCALLTTPVLAENSETSHLELVKLYIAQLEAVENYATQQPESLQQTRTRNVLLIQRLK